MSSNLVSLVSTFVQDSLNQVLGQWTTMASGALALAEVAQNAIFFARMNAEA